MNDQLVAETDNYGAPFGSIGFGIGIEPGDIGRVTAEFDNLFVQPLR